jgi:hypothetical protein
MGLKTNHMKSIHSLPNPNHSNPIQDKSKQAEFEALERGLIKKFLVLSSVAKDLVYIRDHHLYPTHMTFDEYAQNRWGFNAKNIDAMAESVNVVEDLQASGIRNLPSPTSLPQIFEFFGLTRTERVELARRVVQELGQEAMTAEFIHQIKRKMFPDKCGDDLGRQK